MADFTELVKQFHLQRAFLYGFIILSSFFVFAPLGDLQISFGHRCLLYADVTYNVTVTPRYRYFRVHFPSDASVCDYNIIIAVAFSLIYASVAAGGYVFLYFKQKKNKEVDIARLWFLVHCASEVAVLVLVLVSACTISAGFSHVCQQLMTANAHGINLASCSDAQSFQSWRGYDGSNFHVCLSIATVGSWFSFVFWLLQTLFGGWKLWRLNMIYFPDQLKICCKST
ncbi:transmembrane protein 179-like [Haliotis asinina]|uniref:transmembrane protein 179-like n=1 Tax=Haliotis asinina TaxID=109174 RepID=UPI003531EBFB